jgi:hypothetical protein
LVGKKENRMTKTVKRPPRWNPDYPGFIVPEAMCRTQEEIISLVEQGKFEGPKNFFKPGSSEGRTK